ncbi:MAG: hypothetical protein U1F71_03385 [Verrucomicrobiaceae bacterium]
MAEVELADHAAFVERDSHVFDVLDADGLGAVAGEEEAGAGGDGGGAFVRWGTFGE